MDEELEQMARRYHFKIHQTPRSIWLNLNLADGRYTRNFERPPFQDSTEHAVQKSHTELVMRVIEWLRVWGPRFEALYQMKSLDAS
jgi:hypothetical protein